MHLLDGSCSDALAERLGWVVPPPSNVIAGQLFTLGKMYPQVSSMCGRKADACLLDESVTASILHQIEPS